VAWQSVIAVAVAGGGCMGHGLVRGSSDHPVEGAAVGMESLAFPLRIGFEGGYERASTPSGERRGLAGMDVTLRAGLVSTVLRERCPTSCFVEPWVDFGPAVGAGVALTGDLDMIGRAMGGGWLDVRLSPAPSYPVVRLELQRDMYSSRVEDSTQFVVALGYVDWEFRTSRH
jgi:hypothetical protein